MKFNVGRNTLWNVDGKQIDHVGSGFSTQKEFNTTLSWWVDSVGPAGLQFDVLARLDGTHVSATGSIGLRNLSAIRHGPIVSSCSRLPPEPPQFLGPFNRSAYTPGTPFDFIISVSDESTPPAALSVTVNTALQDPTYTVAIANVTGQPSQRRITLTVPSGGSPPNFAAVFLQVTDSDGESSLNSYNVAKQGTVAPTFAQSPNGGGVPLGVGESASVSWTVSDGDTPSGPFVFSATTPGQFPFPTNTYSVASYATISLSPDDASWKTGTATITCTAASPISPGVITGWSVTVTDPNGNTCTGFFGFYLKA